MKRALVFGVTGQIGSYLAEYLVGKGFDVYGAVRRSSSPNLARLQDLLAGPGRSRFTVLSCDVTDPWSVRKCLHEVCPSFVFNLAAQSFVKVSFDEPLHTASSTYSGAVNVLEACRSLRTPPRVYQASSSEMFGAAWSKVDAKMVRHDISHRPPTEHEMQEGCGVFQDEQTPFFPNSPYAVAKLAAHHMVRVYRKSYGLFACAGILFNTESERRGEEFVTRKITRAVGQIRACLDRGLTPPTLELGNLEALRDWSHCDDSVRAMLAILEHDEPDDYCIGTGRTQSVQTFVEKAFQFAGIDDWRSHVTQNEQFMRPCEVPFLRARPAKAAHVLGWEAKVGIDELVARMVGHDIALAKEEVG